MASSWKLSTTLRGKKSLGKLAYLTILLLARISSVRHWHKWEEEP
jgi:hypothetical protein